MFCKFQFWGICRPAASPFFGCAPDNDRGKTEILGEKSATFQFHLPQTPHRLVWYCPRAQDKTLKPKLKWLLTDKQNHTNLIYRFLFSSTTCFDYLHQPSSGRHRFTKSKKERSLLTNSGVKLLLLQKKNKHHSEKPNNNIQYYIRNLLGLIPCTGLNINL